MKNQVPNLPIWLIIPGQFLVFVGLLALVLRLHGTAGTMNLFILEAGLLTAALLLSILVTIHSLIKQRETIILSLKKGLAAERGIKQGNC